jgi:hypothetical protein
VQALIGIRHTRLGDSRDGETNGGRRDEPSEPGDTSWPLANRRAQRAAAGPLSTARIKATLGGPSNVATSWSAVSTETARARWRSPDAMGSADVASAQEENMYLALSPDVVKRYPERHPRAPRPDLRPGQLHGLAEIDGQMSNALELPR